METTPKVVETLDRQTIRSLEQKGRRAVEKKYNTLERLKVEYVPVDSIYPNPYNPNRQSERDFELLKLSIKEDGFTQPILVHSRTRQIIDGEHRWRAMNQLGFKEIPAVFADMTDEQMRISTLRHNRARGSEDVELSIQILRDLRELGALDQAVDSLLINDHELAALLDDVPAPEMMAQEEFSKAWIPSEMGNSTGDKLTERVAIGRRISISDEAMEKMKVFDRQMQELETAPDSNTQMREANYNFKRSILIITATFTTKEAELVRRVLGTKPANSLLELCLRMAERHPDYYPEEVVITGKQIRGRQRG